MITFLLYHFPYQHLFTRCMYRNYVKQHMFDAELSIKIFSFTFLSENILNPLITCTCTNSIFLFMQLSGHLLGNSSSLGLPYAIAYCLYVVMVRLFIYFLFIYYFFILFYFIFLFIYFFLFIYLFIYLCFFFFFFFFSRKTGDFIVPVHGNRFFNTSHKTASISQCI